MTGQRPAADEWAVTARRVLTMAPAGVLDRAGVRVRDGRIAAVGSAAEVTRGLPPDRIEELGDSVLLPGLISTHGHFSEGLLAGTADALSLMEWKDRVLAPTAGLLTREHARIGTALRARELLLSGVTTVADLFVSAPGPATQPVMPGVVEGLERIGLRAVLAYGAKDVGAPWGVDAVMREHDALQQALRGASRLRYRLGLANVLSASPDLLKATARRRVDEGVPVHVHAHEVREEIVTARRMHGASPLELLDGHGLLQDAIVAHAVWLGRDDPSRLAANGAGVAHNPVSNMVLASGACDLGRLRDAGVPVGLGVDGAASNDRQDLLEVIKTALLLRRVTTLDPRALTALEALELATIGGAHALGLHHDVGSIEVGKAADLVAVSADGRRLLDVEDPAVAVAVLATPSDISRVWVDGERLVRNGQLCRGDLDDLLPRARQLRHELRHAIDDGQRPTDRPVPT